MKFSLYYIQKYWRKHKISAVTLMFSAVLMVAILTCSLLIYRGEIARKVYDGYDSVGFFDEFWGGVSDDTLSQMQADKHLTTGYISIIGKGGSSLLQYTAGSLYDENNLARIQFESGKMPTGSGEIAITRQVLDNLNWLGKVGENITLEINNAEETFKVSGIISAKYGDGQGWQGSEVSEVQGAFAGEYPIPQMFLCNADAEKYETLYKNVMFLENISDFQRYENQTSSEIRESYFDKYASENTLALHGGHELTAVGERETTRNLRWFFILVFISVIIAILSVYTVLKQIFLSRKNNLKTLHRIGMSKSKIRIFLSLECCGFIIIQTVIGTLLGISAYLAIYKFQVNSLDMSAYSAFIDDDFIKSKTPNPYLISAIICGIVTILSYLFSSIKSFKINIKYKNARSLFMSIGRVFARPLVTTIQTLSLTLILFGTMLGYMYYTDNGKTELLPYVGFNTPVSYVVDNIDMGKAGIDEYYSAPLAGNIGNGNFVFADENYTFGVDENVINKLGNVAALGTLKQTLIAYDEPNTLMETEIFVDEEFVKTHDFDLGVLKNKTMYNCPTMLSNFATAEKLVPYIAEGEFNREKIESGEEIIFVRQKYIDYIKVGDIIEIASIIPNENYAPKEILTKKVKVGAIVNSQDIPEKEYFLKSIFGNEQDGSYYFLTTATGAKNIGLHNAVYTKIFAPKPVSGSLIPPDSGMKVTLLSDLKHQIFLEKAMEYGGLALIIILMSLLGFSAYFSGISMKINQKSYQISVLRAIGMNKKKIQKRFFIDNLKIPVIAGIITYGLVIAVQKYIEHGYNLLVKLNEPDATGTIFADEKAMEKMVEISDKYLLQNRLWTVPVEIPLLFIFAIMCVVTVILTLISLRKFRGNIADTLNSGRERL